MKAKELRDLSDEELALQAAQMRRERFELLNEFKQTKKIEGAHRLRVIRRSIARVLTIQKQRERQAATS